MSLLYDVWCMCDDDFNTGSAPFVDTFSKHRQQYVRVCVNVCVCVWSGKYPGSLRVEISFHV